VDFKLSLLGRRACGFLYQKCPVGLKYTKNELADPAEGAHDAPQTPNRLGMGHPLPNPTPLGAFGTSIFASSALIFCAPNVKSWLRPCMVRLRLLISWVQMQ